MSRYYRGASGADGAFDELLDACDDAGWAFADDDIGEELDLFDAEAVEEAFAGECAREIEALESYRNAFGDPEAARDELRDAFVDVIRAARADAASSRGGSY